jgi:5-methylcytosine-specific restriction endonuclease McrA
MADRRKQCGALECKRRLTSERAVAYQRAYKERTGKWYSQRYERKPERLIDRICQNCGKAYQSTRSNDTGCCSQACVFLLRRAPQTQVELYAGLRMDPRERRAASITPLPSLRRCWYAGRCPECGTWFVSTQPEIRSCSKSCAHRAAGSRRRALLRDAFVAPVSRIAIYERDNWTCQLCGKPVDRESVTPSPLAPSIDHIIPLANGGTHEPANVQCAHFLCNSLKGAGDWLPVAV